MLGWAIGFFVAAVIAAIFGFGGVATAFIGIAQLLFWVFVALFVLSLIFGLFTGGGEAVGAGGTGRAAAALVAVVAVGLLVYAWMDNHWSAEKVGRAVDRGAAELSADASHALDQAGNRAERLADNTNNDIHRGTNNARDHDQN